MRDARNSGLLRLSYWLRFWDRRCRVNIKFYIFPVHAIKESGGSRGIHPLILNFVARWRWVVNFMPWLLYPKEGTPVPLEQEVGWAPGAVWTFGGEKHFFTTEGFEPRTVACVNLEVFVS